MDMDTKMSGINTWVVTLVLILAITIIPSNINASLGNIGDPFQSEKVKEGGVKGLFLLENTIVPEKAAVYLFSAYIVDTSPVWFQIWRPVNTETKLYSLVGQVRFTATLVPKLYNITITGPQMAIFAESGDVVAIHNEVDICPLAYRFIPDSPTYHYSVKDITQVVPGFEAKFGTTSMPYQFAVKVYYDTDLSKYTGTRGPLQTTDQNPASHTIPSIPKNTGSFMYTGNDLSGKSSYMKEEAQGMFIFPHLTLKYGVIVRFYAHFIKREEVVFQVWRPYVIRNGAYILVGEYRYRPDLVPQTMQIDLSSEDYIFVQPGDLLGFTFPNQIGPIGYRFLEKPDFVGPYRASIVQNKMPQIGEVVNFNMEKYPYDFAIGVFYDTNVDPLKYGTAPPSLPIYPPSSPSNSPESTSESPTSPPTTPIIIKVPDDFELLGKKYLQVAPRMLDSNAMRTFILPDLLFPTSGEIASYYAYIVKSGTVHFQIWRRQETIHSSKFQLVSSKKVTVPTPGEGNFKPRLYEFSLLEGDETDIISGDCIGFANEQAHSVIGHMFQQTQLYTSPDGLTAKVKDVVTFSMMQFPYQFSIGAVYKATEATTKGIKDSTTKDGDDDDNDNDDRENKTPVPEPQAEEINFLWTMDSKFVFGLFIWLIILSVLFILLAICTCALCCQRSKQVESKRTSFLYDYESKNSVTRPPSAYLSNTQETMTYFNPKTGNKNGPVMRGDSMKEKLIEGEEERTTTRRKRDNYSNTNNNNIQTVSETENEVDDGKVTVVDISGDASTHM